MQFVKLSAIDGGDMFIGSEHIVMVTPVSGGDRAGTSVLLSTGFAIQVKETVSQLVAILGPGRVDAVRRS